MFKSLMFVLRIAIAWGAVIFLAVAMYSSLPLIGSFELPAILFVLATSALVLAGAFSHIRRVKLIAGIVNRETLANRQKRQIEIPFEAGLSLIHI